MPLFVTVFIPAPVNPPSRTSKGAIDICTCSIASKGTGSAFDCPPGAGSSNPNGLLKYDPSREMLLYNQFLPPKLILPSLRGSNRVRSLTLLLIEGISCTCSTLTYVAAPVLPLFIISSISAVTTTPATSIACCVNRKSILAV